MAKRVRIQNTSQLIASLSEMILKRTRLLPHTNAGSLTKKELSMLSLQTLVLA